MFLHRPSLNRAPVATGEPFAGLLTTLLVTLMIAKIASSELYQPTVSLATTTTNNSSSTNPYWRRPGCHRVGHTRTISIPGCVKFNLSTNACRGYCMSYSIPAGEDLAGSSSQTTSLQDNFQMFADSQPTIESSLKSATAISGALIEPPEDKKFQIITGDSSATAGAAASAASQRLRHRLNQLISNNNNHNNRNHQHTGAAGLFAQDQQQSAERRDVVSVSQCCSMMETEDVVVNLRCGSNEIRRLIFKSAKTCECFFCKHV